ncbi:hypothetical protein Bpfe_019880 [Biomphalaria pfeifferi]|uniref:Uncharacterized protein n=1 Tax=Biomphalaria pfeifferi TaxID=112525 RepID=A0AAD8BA63_BIOPF|nr:hypothetical protein Bpfe_019880 [Biomphalaria pfeifferi]
MGTYLSEVRKLPEVALLSAMRDVSKPATELRYAKYSKNANEPDVVTNEYQTEVASQMCEDIRESAIMCHVSDA